MSSEFEVIINNIPLFIYISTIIFAQASVWTRYIY